MSAPKFETCLEGGQEDPIADIDNYAAPRRSNRVTNDIAEADGDTWTERIAVCEGVTDAGAPQLLLRSYYRNARTGARKWDEPPSGASNIQHATTEQRKKAELQMQELQLTLDMIPPDIDNPMAAAAASQDASTPKKKKGFFGRFRGGGGGSSNNNKKEKKQMDEAQDLNLQRAIARSMADQRGGGSPDDPVIFYDPESSSPIRAGAGEGGGFGVAYHEEDDDELAMAKAISMSEAEAAGHVMPDVPQMTKSSAQQNPRDVNSMSEEEMLQRAIEESRREAEQSQAAQGVASLPQSTDHFGISTDGHGSFSHSSDALPPTSGGGGGSGYSDEFWDQKMPAKKAAPPTVAVNPFDPYAAASRSNPPALSSTSSPSPYEQSGILLDQPQPSQASPPELLEEGAPHKLGEQDGQKGGRGIARRMFGSKKALQDKAGVV